MSKKGIKKKDLMDFNKTLSLLLLSKLSIVQSLEIIFSKTKNDKFKKVIKGLLNDIKSGSSLSKSFSKYPELFNDIYIANLKVAEETGEVAGVLSVYTAYLETMETIRNKILQAVRYPILVLIVAAVVVCFMVFFLIPMFQGLFFSSKAVLPPLTAFIMDISSFIKDKIVVICLLLSLMVYVFFKIKKTEQFKLFIDHSIIEIPLISKLYNRNLLARFSLCMTILLKSHVTLLEALKISKNISSNKLFKEEIESLIKKLKRGETFSKNISNSKFFDLTFVRMLTVGEESAELEKVFSLIGNYYSKEFDYYLDNLTSLIEPVLILIIGMIVAVILVAMYLPMFEMVNNFGV
ncbi:MAG: type II secretion system F family protein [Bacteroidota bacterium]|nr:type II secretion system F family protein [Bacteroidota bacterium]